MNPSLEESDLKLGRGWGDFDLNNDCETYEDTNLGNPNSCW